MDQYKQNTSRDKSKNKEPTERKLGFSFQDNRTEIAQRKPNKTGLPDALKTGVENLSGYSMDDVRVHYNSAKPSQLNAHAYAQGNQIHLAAGQEKHLPHEAWHVAQQKQGRVQPTMEFNGAAINDNAGLEQEADVMGGKALSVQGSTDKLASSKNSRGVLQGKFKDLDGMKLGKADPVILKNYTSYYSWLYYQLKGAKEIINVLPTDGMSSYDPETQTLYFKPQIVNDLFDDDLSSAVRVSHTATIAHEMQHAHDHIVSGFELRGGDVNTSTEKVLRTELRAWAAEAVTAIQEGVRLKAMDPERGELITGWMAYESDMLTDLETYKGTNCIVKRLWSYISREIHPTSKVDVVDWAKTHKAYINGFAVPLKGWVESVHAALVPKTGAAESDAASTSTSAAASGGGESKGAEA